MAMLWNVLPFLLLCVGALANGIPKELTQNLIPCREGWYLFGEKCYKVEGESKRLDWEKASAQCSQEGGHLATIYSKQMRDFIFTFLLLNAASDAWIGVNDRAQEGKYEWDDGSVLNYTDWEPNEPSGNNYPWEDCIVMRYWTHKSEIGSWNDFGCDNKVPYICQLMKDEKYQNPDPRFCSAERGGGWKYLNSCYHMVTEKKTWRDAEKYCQETFKGHLVTVLDFRTEYFLNYILSNYSQPFWYGINIRNEANHKWSSGWRVIFNRFDENDPFAEGTCALRFSVYTWEREWCALKHSFVCETSTDKPPVEEDWDCPESSKDWSKANGKLCYFFEKKIPRTWHDANHDCIQKGGVLVNIHSKEELNHLYLQFRPLMKPENAFIGLHRKISNKNEFEWSDGSEVSYQHWFSFHPNDINDECVVIHTNIMRWNDFPCLEEHLYVCSAKKVPPPEPEEKLCACKIRENITEIIESAFKKYVLSRNNCTPN